MVGGAPSAAESEEAPFLIDLIELHQVRAAWAAGHRAAAPMMRALGILSLVFAAGLVMSGILVPLEKPPAITLWLFAIGCGAVLIGLFSLAARANHAAVLAEETDDQPPSSAS